jgi:hypothetical protein
MALGAATQAMSRTAKLANAAISICCSPVLYAIQGW